MNILNRISSLLPFFSASFLFLLLSSAHAQEVTHSTDSNDRFFSYSIGYSPQSVRLLGKTRNSKTFISKIGYSRLIKKSSNASIYFTVGLIPFLRYNYSRRDHSGDLAITKGFGISPWGFDLVKPLNKLTSIGFGSSGSIIYMDKIFPSDKARRLNFTFDISTEIQRQVSKTLSFSFGYKFHHISNAQTGRQNPGLDSIFIFFSILTKK